MLTVDDIARIAHEANRGLQAALGEEVSASWDNIRAEMQDSARDGVRAIQFYGFSPADSHANWCEFKRNHGWVYGKKKDEVEKTHPCLVPYEQLPPEQKTKDALFHAIVNALLEDNQRMSREKRS